jgi:hypothetical protein
MFVYFAKPDSDSAFISQLTIDFLPTQLGSHGPCMAPARRHWFTAMVARPNQVWPIDLPHVWALLGAVFNR